MRIGDTPSPAGRSRSRIDSKPPPAATPTPRGPRIRSAPGSSCDLRGLSPAGRRAIPRAAPRAHGLQDETWPLATASLRPLRRRHASPTGSRAVSCPRRRRAASERERGRERERERRGVCCCGGYRRSAEAGRRIRCGDRHSLACGAHILGLVEERNGGEESWRRRGRRVGECALVPDTARWGHGS